MKVEDKPEKSALNQLPGYSSMVLLIDDQPIVGQAVGNLLAGEPDIDFHYCADPQQAVALATDLRPTVILQDLVMPGIDGLHLVRLMRENPATVDTPIIVLSSREDPVSKRDAFAAGANDYLVKLPDKIELIARTRYHSRAHLHRIQRDEAYRALRESQQKLLESNSRLFVANQELEAATRVKSEFLATISHEIRTPLSGVIGMTTLLSDTVLSGEQREFVETIRSSGGALLELINDILDFSRIEAGKLEIENQPFDLTVCIEEMLDLLAVKAGEKRLALGYILDPSVSRRWIGDAGRIRQILMNLIGNAVKFTPRGEVSLHVFLPESQPGWIQFSVRDTGIGIPRHQQDRLFKEFSQVHRSTLNNYGGTGLGLAISKALCEAMGGRIWVESDEGSGSSFHFTLKLEAAVGIDSGERALPGEFYGRRILVIEDQTMHQSMLKSRLRQLHMAPSVVSDVKAAILLLRGGAVLDAIVLSARLPGADVQELVKQIRSEPSAHAVPLILMIPQQARRLYVRGEESGISSLVYEPVRDAQFLEALGDAFHVRIDPPSLRPKMPVTDDNIAARLPMRILVAEDNPVNQRIAVGLLAKLGYRADTAGSGVEAIASLERQPYDLIFMDVQMPEMDGLEASRQIRSQWPNPGFPRIVAMTASAMRGDRERCIQCGMDDYISKPISLQALRDALEHWGMRIRDGKP